MKDWRPPTGRRPYAPALVLVAWLLSAGLSSAADWKQALRHSGLLQARQSGKMPVVRGSSYTGSPWTLGQLHALRDLNTRGFDRLFPKLGRMLAHDDTLRAAVAQGTPVLHGLFAPTPMTRYLFWRRSLDPARFDYYHPLLGPLLAEDQALRHASRSTPEQILPPPLGDGESPGVPSGQGPTGGGGGQQLVPEPTAVVLFAIGAAVLGFARRRRGTAASAR